MKTPFLIGRLMLGGFFVSNGINHLRNRDAMAGYVDSKGVPQPKLAVTLSAIPLLVGGASLILGVKPKWGSAAILGFLAGVSPIMHDFWKNEDPAEREKNKIDFMKNTALAGLGSQRSGRTARTGKTSRQVRPQTRRLITSRYKAGTEPSRKAYETHCRNAA